MRTRVLSWGFRLGFFCVFCGLCFFVLSFQIVRAAGPTAVPSAISEPTTWTKENSPYIITSKLAVNAKLTINPGVVVKFSSSGNWIDAQAEIQAVGTDSDKIYFTSIHDDSVGGDTDTKNEKTPSYEDWDRININPNYPAKFENVVLSYGTTAIKSFTFGTQFENLEIRNSEIKFNDTGIDVRNLKPKIESNTFLKNWKGISAVLDSGYQARSMAIRFNLFNGNDISVFANNSLALIPPTVDARYNWWGDESGPTCRKNPNGSGDSVNNYWVSFDPWLKMNPAEGPDPVIVIPGIMGSWKKDGKWTIDPIFHTYDNLCEEFLANDYKDGKNFFTFPYEWRDSNVENAKKLRDLIVQIKNQSGWPKVDIVAHSMGGLLAREYIESDYYANDVDQLITIGTPQLGAPKDYIKWEAGESFFDFFDMAAKRFLALEALENGYFSIYNYIHRFPIASVEELLPDYNYLYDIENNYALRASYPDNYPRNEFLEELNSPEKAQRLKNVEFTKIIGKLGSVKSVVSGYNVVGATDDKLWQHGYPKSFNNPLNVEEGLQKSDGDKTVPLYSAEALQIVPADKTIYFQSEHNNLPTDAQKDILEILTGKRSASEIAKWHIPNLLIILVHSPVDIQVESPGDQKIGKKFDTNGTYDQIEGAYYTGFDTNSEFITIPNPEDGEYKITAQGMGEGGKYEIEIAKISENLNDLDNAKESSVVIKGNAQPNELKEAKVDVEQDQVIYNSDTTPPTINISSPADMDYTNDKVLAIDYKTDDPESGVANDSWQVEKDGQSMGWKEKNVDLSLEHLGDYIFKVAATDKAGNSGEKKVQFAITTNLDAIQKNVGHYFNDLKLISSQEEFDFYQARLAHTRALFDQLNSARKNKKPLANMQKEILLDIDHLIDHIRKNASVSIDQKTADILIEDFNNIKSF